MNLLDLMITVSLKDDVTKSIDAVVAGVKNAGKAISDSMRSMSSVADSVASAFKSIDLSAIASQAASVSSSVSEIGDSAASSASQFGQLQNAAKNAGTAFTTAGEGAGGFKSALSGIVSAAQSAAAALGKVATAAAKVGSVAAGAAATGLVALTKSAVNSYAEYEQLVGGVETLFRESSQTIQDYAAEAYVNAGISANKYMEQATAFSARLLQALGGDTAAAADMVNQAIIDMSDNANKMGTDLARIQDAYQGFAKGNYTMLDNLKLGYGGTQGEMARLLNDANKLDSSILGEGVVLPETVLPGQSQLAGVGLDQIIRGIKVIQDNLGITGTTADEAMGTITGSLNMAKSAWQDMLTAIANDNADFGVSVDNLVRSVETAFSQLIPRIETAFYGLGDLVSGLGPMVAEALPGMLESFLPGLTEGITSIFTSLSESLPGLVDVILAQVPAMLAALQEVGTSLIGSIQEIAGDIVSSFSEAFMGATGIDLSPLIESITGALEALKTALSGMLEGVDWAGVTSVVNGFLTTVAGAITMVVTAMQGEGFQNFVSALVGMLTTIGGSLVSALQPAADGIRELFKAFLSGDSGVIQSIADAFGAFAKWFETSIAPVIGAVADAVVKLLTPFVEGIAIIITGIADAIGNLLGNFTGDRADSSTRIAEAVVKLLGVFADGLAPIILNIATAITTFITALANGQGTASTFTGTIASLVEWFSGLAENVLFVANKIAELVVKILSLRTTFEEFASGLGEIVGSAIYAAVDAISSAFDSLIQSVKDKISALFNAVKNFDIGEIGTWLYDNTIGGVVDTVKGVFGFAEGVVDGYKEARNNDIVSDIADAKKVTVPIDESTVGKVIQDQNNYLTQMQSQNSLGGITQQEVNLYVSGNKLASTLLPEMNKASQRTGIPVGVQNR